MAKQDYCYYCNRYGHKTIMCPYNRPPSKKKITLHDSQHGSDGASQEDCLKVAEVSRT